MDRDVTQSVLVLYPGTQPYGTEVRREHCLQCVHLVYTVCTMCTIATTFHGYIQRTYRYYVLCVQDASTLHTSWSVHVEPWLGTHYSGRICPLVSPQWQTYMYMQMHGQQSSFQGWLRYMFAICHHWEEDTGPSCTIWCKYRETLRSVTHACYAIYK